jgi:hypothetical protein
MQFSKTMAIESSDFTLYLGTFMRGAPDNLREPLTDTLSNYKSLTIASQQLADRSLTETLVQNLQQHSGNITVFIESDYLKERQPLTGEAVWAGGGDYENNRQCFLVLLRVGVPIRFDNVSAALQHANFILAEDPIDISHRAPKRILITSANLAPGSINKHFNWLIAIDSDIFAETIQEVFKSAWDGDFRDVGQRIKHDITDKGIRLVVGAKGEVLETLKHYVDHAQSSIDLAFFNISTSSALTESLVAARGRGVTIRGVVDGDQMGQSWDAIPLIQGAGGEVKYYPGVLTGATGRMHYKMALIDDKILHFGTANISKSAEESLEIGIFMSIEDINQGALLRNTIQSEIRRLEGNAFL